jgi:membrane protein required for colicin V production
MNGADYLIIAVLALSMLLGFLRGFLKESISLIAWLGGIWIAFRFSGLVEPHLGGLLAREPVNTWAARAIVLLTIVFLGWIVAALASWLVRQSNLSLAMDRWLGACFGFVRGAVWTRSLCLAAPATPSAGSRRRRSRAGLRGARAAGRRPPSIRP